MDVVLFPCLCLCLCLVCVCMHVVCVAWRTWIDCPCPSRTQFGQYLLYSLRIVQVRDVIEPLRNDVYVVFKWPGDAQSFKTEVCSFFLCVCSLPHKHTPIPFSSCAQTHSFW